MILVLCLALAAIVVAATNAWMIRRGRPIPREHRDLHWGDWPPDQMGR